MVQRSAAPGANHHWWGQFSDPTQLPNVSGAPLQVTNLQEGDMAWLLGEKSFTGCIDSTLGAALWETIMTISASQLDAFGRLRVSNPQSLFDSKQVYDNGVPLLMVHSVTGAGAAATYDGTNARTILTSGTDAGGRATRQSRRYFNYQSGKSQSLAMTFNMNGAQANCEKRAGIFDDTNGLYLALPASGVPAFVRRSTSGVGSSTVSQPSWNLDKLDGTGSSGITLDLSKAQIFVIDFQWLGTGNVRLGFQFGTQIVYAHTFEHANIVGGVYLATPNLPIRWEIANSAPAASPTLDAICCSMVSEGGQDPVGTHRGFARTTALNIAAAVTRPLLSIRLKAAYNRATVFPTSVFATATSANSQGALQLLLNAVLGGATAFVAQPDSAIEVDVGSTTVAGGYVLAAGTVGVESSIIAPTYAAEPAVTAASDFSGTPDILTLALTSIQNDDWIGAINWREML